MLKNTPKKSFSIFLFAYFSSLYVGIIAWMELNGWEKWACDESNLNLKVMRLENLIHKTTNIFIQIIIELL